MNHSASKIYFNTFELIGFEMYWGKGYEKEVTWIYDHLIQEDHICIDIGANIGVHTILLCEKAKHVHAYEPHPIFREKLKRNLDLNKFTNITIHAAGLSSYAGDAILHAPPSGMRNKSATICDINDELTENIKIDITTLNEIEGPAFDFVKIDCDGSDAAIILGGTLMLEHYKPIILFEDLSWRLAENLNDSKKIKLEYFDAYSLLRNMGYKVYGVASNSLIELNGDVKGYENVLAVHRDDKLCNVIRNLLTKVWCGLKRSK